MLNDVAGGKPGCGIDAAGPGRRRHGRKLKALALKYLQNPGKEIFLRALHRHGGDARPVSRNLKHTA